MRAATFTTNITLLLSLAWGTSAHGQVTQSVAAKDAKRSKMDELVSRYAAYGQFSGAVLVAEKGNVLFKRGFGLADREWDVPNGTDTKFRLASITKQFTAMLIMQLVAENKLALDIPIARYLPDYPKANAERITIGQLLSHTSGIPNYTDMPNYRELMVKSQTPAELLSAFADSALQFTPGDHFAYSNSGYMVLGAIVERITGKSYEQELQERIFTPLNMTNSGVDNGNTVLKNRARGYYQAGTTFTNASYIDMSTPFSAGSIYSTVEDMYLWDEALYTTKLLPEQYRDLMFQPHIAIGDGAYGYGWEIGDVREGNSKETSKSVSHSGGINGFNTLITRIPADSILIVALSNTSDAPLGAITVAINGILHDQGYDAPKRSLALVLSATMEKEGIDQALSQFSTLKKSNDQYYVDEAEMNATGYQLLRAGKKKEAAALMKMNSDAFPYSFNAYDSYGEALLAIGDTAKAVKNYIRSVQLDAHNTNGLQVLQRLGIATDNLAVKVPVKELRLLAGAYTATKETSPKPAEWTIVIEEKDGQLYGNNAGYHYTLAPIGNNAFMNPDDGATVVFDTTNKKAITFVLFGKVVFKKVK